MKSFILVFGLIILFGCQNDTSDNKKVEQALLRVCNRFPQLPKVRTNLENFYKLNRTIKIGDRNIEIQLRETPDSLSDSQQLILIKNPKGDISAIPLFSNTYRDYYNFQFDNPIPNIPITNSTFIKEYINTINELGLNDSLQTGRIILYEILKSLLQCDVVTGNDTTILQLSVKGSDKLPEENYDSCLKRIDNNIKSLRKFVHPNEWTLKYLAYWDYKNKRIYTFETHGYINDKFSIKADPEFKVYRFDCIQKPLPILDL